MPYFPVDQRLSVAGGYNEDKPDNKIWSNKKLKTGSVRRKFRAVPETFTGSLRVSEADMNTIMDFHDETLADGTLKFEWVHPRKRTACKMMFESRPKLSHVGGAVWDVRLNLVTWKHWV